MVKSSGFLFVPTLRSCFRCGKEFRAADKERICMSCRKPPEMLAVI